MSKKQVTIIVENEIKCTIEGLSNDHITFFADSYAMYAPNYRFNPMFKLGRWDGKIRFFSRAGQTYVTMLPELIQAIVKLGYEVDVDDRREATFFKPELINEHYFGHIVSPNTGEPIVLRDYQVRFVNQLIESGNGIGVAATSAGKAQPLTSNVLTPGGWKPMGAVEVGNRVITVDNQIAEVVGVFYQGIKDCVELVTDDNRRVQCCPDHLWFVTIQTSDQSCTSRVVSTKTIETLINSNMVGYSISVPDSDGTLHQIVEIVRRDPTEMQCIMIDHPSKLYVTDGHLLTHNTFICGALTDSYRKVGASSIVIVPSDDLIRQTRTEFAGLGIETGEYSGALKDVNGWDIIVSTWQALKNNPTVLASRDVVVVDECHGAKANVLQTLLTTAAANTVHRFGVTGTLPEHPMDARTVLCCIGPVVDEISAASLIEKGVLATLHIYMVILQENLKSEYEDYLRENPNGVDYKAFKAHYLSDYAAEKKYITKKPSRTEWIAQFIHKRCTEGGNTLTLVQNVSMGRALAAMMPNAHFIYGDDEREVRKQVYDLFKTGDNVNAIATYGIASTGISINRIKELVLVDIGKSFTRVIQSIGRGLRTAPDKKHVSVWDIHSDLSFSCKHATKRRAMYTQASYPFTNMKVDYETELAEAKIKQIVEM